MTDLDRRLEKAASDVRQSLGGSKPPSPDFARLVRRRAAGLAVAAIAVLALPLALFAGTMGGELATGDGRITSEQILEDGRVTEEEYRAAVEAVVACLNHAGYEAGVRLDDPDRPTLWTSEGGEEVQRALDACEETHLDQNVSLGWAVAQGLVDLEEYREETTSVFDCVESRTGKDFGELSFDGFGYLTPSGHQAQDAAFEYDDHIPWGECRNDLGYEEAQKAETLATFDCVEEKTGIDFGEISFNSQGHVDQVSQPAFRQAMNHENHAVWVACRADLGFGP